MLTNLGVSFIFTLCRTVDEHKFENMSTGKAVALLQNPVAIKTYPVCNMTRLSVRDEVKRC